MDSTEVLIVGGGVIGASVAYHLAARGCTDVVVLDAAARAGEGSTGRATGGFRAQFGTTINVRLSLLAREKLRRFPDELGVDPGYRPVGYLFLARKPRELAVLKSAQALQRAAGLTEAVEVAVEDVAALNPAVAPDELLGGVFCPTDGFLHPLEVLRGYREAAERLGVRFHYGVRCTGLRLERRRILAARTASGEIATGQVVNAAGAWAAGVAGFAGVDLPVSPVVRQVAVTAPTDVLPDGMPMTIFAGDGFHLRVRDGRVLLLWPSDADGNPDSPSVDTDWLDQVRRLADARIPALREVPIERDRCWAGFYEMSPDRHVILGAASDVENFFLANGSSGHGVMHAPALGALLAEILLDGAASTLDLHDLRPGRFADGQPIVGLDLL